MMVNVKSRSSKAERLEVGSGHLANIFGIDDIIGIGGTVIGGLLGAKSAKDTSKAIENANEESLKYQGLPRWAEEQKPYVFGPGKQFQTPMMNAEALNYAAGLSGGFNPAYGPTNPQQYMQGPYGVMGGLLGYGGQGPYLPMGQQQQTPWFMNPGSNPFAQGDQGGGLMSILGFGRGTPPPLFANDPRLGYNVRNPEGLMGNLPGQKEGGAAPEIKTPPQAVPQPTQPQAPRTAGGVVPTQAWNPPQTMNDALALYIRSGIVAPGLDVGVASKMPRTPAEQREINRAITSTERFNRIMRDGFNQ